MPVAAARLPTGGLMSQQYGRPGPALGNRLLANLPTASRKRLAAHLTTVPLVSGDILLKPDARAGHFYFPDSGMVSLVLTLEDGTNAEVGTVGRNGLVGVLPALGARRTVLEAMVQIPGTAQRIPARTLRNEAARDVRLNALLVGYTQALFRQVAQSVACNGRHMLKQRLARWLLMAADHAGSDSLALNHEFLAMMLGVRRPGVTLALQELRKSGAIATRRGNIDIIQRKHLESFSCECYGTVSRAYTEILG